MSRVSIEGSYEPFEVDLWGHAFETRDLPRSDAAKIREIEKLADENDDEDRAVELIGQMLDIKLVPATEGRSQKPSTILKRKWKADELTTGQLFHFIDKVGEAEAAARPT